MNIKKIIKNIKWAIFNHPPTGLTSYKGDEKCDYCGGDGGLWVQCGVYIICANCRKKVYDAILKKEKSDD